LLDPVEHQIASGGLEPVDGIDGHRMVANQDFRGSGFGIGHVRPSLNSYPPATNGRFPPEAAIRAEASFTEFFQLISFCLTAYQSAN
jgi:hypothetical protein